MSVLQQQIERVRRRMNLNGLLERCAGACALAAAAAAALIAASRAFGWAIPIELAIAALAGLGLAAAVVLTFVRAAGALDAAIVIDQAAGLKERVGSAVGLQTRRDDPFVSATVRDAERIAGGLHVPTHVPLRMPQRWPHALTGVVLAGLVYAFMPTLDLFAAGPERVADQPLDAQERQDAEQAVNQVAERLKERAQQTPGLEGLTAELGQLELPDDPSLTPDDVRREVVKRTENIADKLREKLDATELKSMSELKRQLAKLETPKGSDPASKLSQALAEGDAEAAARALAELQKQIAEASESADPELKKQLAEAAAKLEQLSQQLDKLASNEAAKKELENKAGMSAEQAEQMMQKLAEQQKQNGGTPPDAKQIAEALKQALGEQNQLTPEQIQQIAQKIAQNQQAQQALKQMAQAMQQAAQACENPGQGQGQMSAEAQQALQAAAQQLSEMEMAEQMANELQAAMSEIQDLQNKARDGQGMGTGPQGQPGPPGENFGQGYGPTDKKAAAHGYEAQRIRAKLQGGEIIGQMLIDGPMVRGEATVEVSNALNAAVRDATEAIDRQELPRQYDKVLRNYFMSLAGLAGPSSELSKPEEPAPAKDSGPAATPEPATSPGG